MKAIREAYGDALVEMGAKYSDIVVLDADLCHATSSIKFANAYPERFINTGIAEQNLFCISTGLAHSGFKPYASTFALFAAGRAYEQIRNSICYSNANVKIVVSHAGITACGDGGSHQAIEDIALMRAIPNIKILCPCDYNQAKNMIKQSYDIKGPVYIRMSRPPVPTITEEKTKVDITKAQVMKDGTDICLVATGIMVAPCLEAASALEEQGISTAVINIHTIKPIDDRTLLQYAKKCSTMLTVEEHSIIGGLGSAVTDVIMGKENVKFDKIGVEDRFGQSGLMHQLLEEYGLTTENILAKAKKLYKAE